MPRFRVLLLDWERIERNDRFDCTSSFMKEVNIETLMRVLHRNLFRTYELEAPNVEEVFYLLNVEFPSDYHYRSMSVGDIAIDLESHKAMRCGGVSWHEVTHLMPQALLS